MTDTDTLTDYRAVIRRVGLRLFAERGVDAVSVAELCREADIANGTFYNFYSNKSELVGEFLTDTYEALAKLLRDAEGRGSDAESEHRRDVTIIIDFTVLNSELIKIAMRDEGARRMAQRNVAEMFVAQRTSGLRRGIASGMYLPDLNAELVARSEHGLMSEIINWWLENPDRISRDDLIERLVAIRLRITNGKVEK